VGGSGQESELSYANSFTCIPFDVPYRPPRLTPKPVVEGTQTAIVVGPAGEEIYPDEHGRVKVQFHWDREGTNDENSSCWIRVSQVWAGAGWGAMHIPRIGQEVIVDFLEGDPDRPIITGRVYNGTNTPPYSLPDEKTKSTIKSDSSLGGGGSNEIRFEDKKGEEEIYLHGQKDWTIAIENDKNQTVGHDETLSVGNDKTIEIGANHTESIGANMSIRVGKNKTETVTINTAETIGVAKELTIGGAYQVTVGAAMNETVGGAKMEEVGAYKMEAVGGNKSETIGGSKSLSTGKGLTEKVGKSQSVEISENLDEKVGGKHIEQVSKEYAVNAKKIQLMAEDQIVLKTGKAEIVMKKNGDIMIKGKKIQIKGSGDVIIKGSKIKEN
ncbi:MAG: type VI secretion system tip protein VgrG, partial [Deltaproteobacteria bacterium]|nr:type VI secretion system tip protein VgrG [Deltaproteobacteria bacterium]